MLEGDDRVEGLFVVVGRQPLLTCDPLIDDVADLILDFALDLVLALLCAPLQFTDIFQEFLLRILVHAGGATLDVLHLSLVLFD